jgi:hypothetical protein
MGRARQGIQSIQHVPTIKLRSSTQRMRRGITQRHHPYTKKTHQGLQCIRRVTTQSRRSRIRRTLPGPMKRSHPRCYLTLVSATIKRQRRTRHTGTLSRRMDRVRCTRNHPWARAR